MIIKALRKCQISLFHLIEKSHNPNSKVNKPPNPAVYRKKGNKWYGSMHNSLQMLNE